MPLVTNLEVEHILDTCVTNKTRKKEYLEYLVKWKDHPMEDSTWMDETPLQQYSHSVEDIMSRSSKKFLSWEA